MTDGIDNAIFRTSSFSGGANCLQARQLESGDIVVRDSRNPSVSIVVAYNSWVAFVLGVKNEEFDFGRK